MKNPKPDIQTAFMIVSLLWGMYWLTSWRTQDFGFSLRGTLGLALLACLSVLPITVLAVLGLPWRKALSRLALALLIMIGFAEVFASTQEILVVQQRGDNSDKQIFIARWPPFENHFIGYSPGHGWMGGD
jgi:hypothetical protein